MELETLLLILLDSVEEHCLPTPKENCLRKKRKLNLG